MAQMQEQVSDLRSLASLKPTPERLAKITAALDSKFEGIQSVALQVLGQWGGTESVDLLRKFLTRAFTRHSGWSIRVVAVTALAPHLRPADAEWVLNLYFVLPNVLLKHEIFPLVTKLPVVTAYERLKKELASTGWMNRQAAVKAIGNMPFPGRNQLIYPLLNDPNKQVRTSARAASGQVGRRSNHVHAGPGRS
jgi:HEAT repeat protein